MRFLLAAVLLLCSGAVAAQADNRRVRTVEIDDGAVAAVHSDERREAEHPDEHLVLARQLADLGPDSGAGCMPDPATLRADIAAAYRASPRDFYGISPRSAYWKDVEQAWRDYYAELCAPEGDESPAAIIARSYAESLSADELREVLAFQDSPAGRAFIAATRRARQQLDHTQPADSGGDPAAASARFRQTMLQLQAKHGRPAR